MQLQTSGLPDTMTGREALAFFSRYHQRTPDYSILDRFGLKAKAQQQYGTLSVDQKRRLALAIAVSHEPQIVILDEPTAGLDVESRMELHEMMRELKAAGTTIVLATHDMAEAEKLCDRIAIIIQGKLGVVGTPSQITAAGDQRTRIQVASANGTFLNGAPELPGAVLTGVADGYARYSSESPSKPLSALIRLLEEHNDELVDLRVEHPSLEERFMEITRRNQ